MKKRLLALLVAFAMIVSLLPVQVFAAESADADASLAAQSDVSESEAEQPETDKSEAEQAEPEADKSEAEQAEPEADKPEAEQPEAEPQTGETASLRTQELADAIDSIEVEPIWRFDSNRCDPDPEDGNFRRIDCWPDNLTVTLKDGQEFKLEEYDRDDAEEGYNPMDAMADAIAEHLEMNQGSIQLYWTTDENSEHPWDMGDHKAFIILKTEDEDEANAAQGNYDVHVIGVKSIECPATVTRDVHNRVRSDDVLYNGKVECWPDWFKVTITDGNDEKVFDSTREDYANEGGDLDMDKFCAAIVTEYPGLRGVWFDWWSDEMDAAEPWEVGEHQAQFFCGAYWDENEHKSTDEKAVATYTVNVKASPIKSIKADNLEVFETRWDWEDCRDEEAHHDHDQWKRLDCWPNKITVTLTDGGTLAGDPDQVCEELRTLTGLTHIDWGWTSEQEESTSTWYHKEVKAGSEITAWFDMLGVESEPYTVTATQSPIQALEVSPISRYASDLDYRGEYDGEPKEWSCIDCWPDKIKVTTADDECEGDPDEVENWLREKYDYGNFEGWEGTRTGWDSDQRPAVGEQAAVTWAAGDEQHQAEFFFGGSSAVYDVTVVEPLEVNIVEAREIWRLDSDREWCDKWVPSVNSDIGFDRVSANTDYIKATVAGETYEGDPWQVREEIQEKHPGPRVRVDWDSDEMPVWDDKDKEWYGNWEAGEHQATITLMNVSKTYKVHVIDPDEMIESVTADHFTRYDNDRFGTWDDDQEEWKKLDCTPDHVVVKLKDGTVFDSDEKNGEGEDKYNDVDDMVYNGIQEHLRETYPGINISWGWDSDEKPMQNDKGEWVGDYVAREEPYPVRINVCGVETECTVTVVAAPKVEDFTVQNGKPVYRFVDDRDESWKEPEGGREDVSFRRVNADPSYISVKVSGKTYEGNPWDVCSQIEEDIPGVRVRVDWDSDEVPVWDEEDDVWVGSWTLTNHHYKAWIEILGERQEYEVILVDPELVITEVTVPAMTRLESDREEIWDDDISWWRLRCDPGRVTVKAEGEQYYDDGLWELTESLEAGLQEKYPGIHAWIEWHSSEVPKDEREQDGRLLGNWTAGEHKFVEDQDLDCAWLDVCGKFVPYTVNVIDNPITKVSVEPITRFVTDRRTTYDEEKGKTWRWIDVMPDTLVTLTLTNNTTVTGYLARFDADQESLYYKLRQALNLGENDSFELGIQWGSDEVPDENGVGARKNPWGEDLGGSWKVGSYPNGAWVSVGGIEGRFDVKVIDNPVVKTEIPSRTMADTPENRLADGEWKGVLNCPPEGTIKVWLKDGTLVEGDWTYENEELGIPSQSHIETKLQEALKAKGGDLAKARVWVDWGNNEYADNLWSHGRYTCSLWFSGKDKDEETGNEFNYLVNLTNAEHHLNPVAAVQATCTAPGKIAYWLCETCGKLFRDAAGTDEITEADTVIAATGHNLVKTEAKAATCTEAGNIAYWTCSHCNKIFRDQNGTQEISQAQTVIAATGHNLVKTEAKAATCTEAGHIAYWTCSHCNKIFRDQNGTQVISQAETVIPATGNHSWDAGAVTTAPTDSAEGVRTYTCTVCGTTRQESVPKLAASLPAMKGLKVKAKKTTATVTWKKNAKAKKYQIQYSLDKNFSSILKTITTKNNKTLKTTVKKLKKGKTYYFRIRAIKGDNFSAWSVKKVKVKK